MRENRDIRVSIGPVTNVNLAGARSNRDRSSFSIISDGIAGLRNRHVKRKIG
jgi:hypothetical protein